MYSELEQVFEQATPQALSARESLPIRRHREDKVGQGKHTASIIGSIVAVNGFASVLRCILLCSAHTGSYSAGKARIDLEAAELQGLYAPVVAAHGNRSNVREAAGVCPCWPNLQMNVQLTFCTHW